MGLPKELRLRRSVDVRRVLSKGRTRAGSLTVFYWLNRDCGSGSRVATIASRRLGNAVIRNKVRRRIAELMRSELNDFSAPLDIVVVARRKAASADFDQLKEEIGRIMRYIRYEKRREQHV